MNEKRARDLLAAERTRLERELARHKHEDDGEWSDPFFDQGNLAAKLYQDELEESLAEDLRRQLAALERTEQRLAAGTYGLSIESGERIPDERLEVLPTAELTAEEERAVERYRG
jgi:DnaK suppressor protein